MPSIALTIQRKNKILQRLGKTSMMARPHPVNNEDEHEALTRIKLLMRAICFIFMVLRVIAHQSSRSVPLSFLSVFSSPFGGGLLVMTLEGC